MRAETTAGAVEPDEPGAENFLRALERMGDGFSDLRFASIHSVGAQPGDVDAALDGSFRLGDRRFSLVPPVDWWDGPYREPGERAFFQNSFVFADPLLSDPRRADLIEPLAAIFADWLVANPRRDSPHPHRYAWHDHAAAARLVYMAFVLREGVRGGALAAPLRLALAGGVFEHATFLLADEHYASNHNHGLFSDAALALASRSLAPVPPSERWAAVAERRFAAVLDRTVAAGDAVHLEHSPYYHWIIHGALSRFAAAGLFPALDLNGLLARMEEAGSWLVAPDGTLPPIGDTPFGRRPSSSVQRAAAAKTGLRLFREAGYAAVRRGDSCLLLTAAHHPTAHKHADDGSFCLYERGLPLVIDSGDPGYDYESPERRYGTSPAAHATVCVDDFDWTTAPAYGSGLIAASEENGVYALLTANPGAVPGGGAARRVFLYAPARFLVLVDLVDAGPERMLRRHLPLAPDLRASVFPTGRVEVHRDRECAAALTTFAPADAPAEAVELAVGRRHPVPAGIVFPAPGESLPHCSLTFSAPSGHPRGLALVFPPERLEPIEFACEARDGAIELEIGGLARGSIHCRAEAGSIELSG